jgi:hypothetical protein
LALQIERIHRAKEKCRIDLALNGYDRVTLKQPSFKYDLKSIELGWSKVKTFIREHRVGADFYINRLRELRLKYIE